VAVALVATERLPAKEPLQMPALASPHPSAAMLPAPEPPPPPPAPASDEKTAAFTAPPSPSPPPRLDEPKPLAAKPTAPSKKPRVAVEPPKPVVRQSATPSEPMPGIAVYDVVVDARGQVRSVTLVHSSGTTSIDASGEAMIRSRSGTGFDLCPDAGPNLNVFTCTIALTPEGR
jgi:hypothetical protein